MELRPVHDKEPKRCRCMHGMPREYCDGVAHADFGLCSACLEFQLYRGTVDHYVQKTKHTTATNRNKCGL